MDDLISRKALIAEYDRVHIGPPGGARKLMEDAPAVDAVEVVHGRWAISGDIAVCTICHSWVMAENGTEDLNYCNYCGAKMDGDGND